MDAPSSVFQKTDLYKPELLLQFLVCGIVILLPLHMINRLIILTKIMSMASQSPPRAPRAMQEENSKMKPTDQPSSQNISRQVGTKKNTNNTIATAPGNTITWTSDEAKMRDRFNLMRKTASYSGFGNSPYLPHSVAEYAEVLADRKTAEIKHLARKVQEKQQPPQVPVQPLLLGKDVTRQDLLSPVLNIHSPFNKQLPARDAPDGDGWPPGSSFNAWKGNQGLPPPFTQ